MNPTAAPTQAPPPAKEQVYIPSMLRPVTIVTETQLRRDQAGVTGDLELVHPSDARLLEEVIQATGVRADAAVRRLMKKKASEPTDTIPSKPVTPEETSTSSSESTEAGTIGGNGDDMLAVKPSIIVVPIPQATDTLEAPITEVCLHLYMSAMYSLCTIY